MIQTKNRTSRHILSARFHFFGTKTGDFSALVAAAIRDTAGAAAIGSETLFNGANASAGANKLAWLVP